MNTYIVLFRFTKPGEKSPGPIQQYRVNARTIQEAWEQAREYGNYPGIQIIDVVEA